MNLKNLLHGARPLSWGVAILPLVCSPVALANVYPTDIKLNGRTALLAAPPGAPVQIAYRLNEAATGGVTISVESGGAVAHTIEVAPGSPGALRGKNEVNWNGRLTGGTPLDPGTYRVKVTARANGFAAWTQITDETSDGNYVWEGTGIAVNRNPTSPCYGRVFVANSYPGLGTKPGDMVGILKLNSDASPAEDGQHSTGGYPWAGNRVSPWKVEVSTDDFVYASDLAANGTMMRWDQTMASTSRVDTLRQDNLGGRKFGGPAASGSGTNLQLWVADLKSPTSGIRRFSPGADGLCLTNDPGIVVIGTGGGTYLSLPPQDVALDHLGNIYTIQSVDSAGDPASRVLRFRAYDPATNNGVPLLVSDWAVGAGDDTYARASGISVDPTGTFVAVSFRGLSGFDNGNTKILYATNGALAVDLDLGKDINGLAYHDDSDCAWDAAGNIYYVDVLAGVWRAFSPPGANQSATTAPAALEIIPPPPPQITYFGFQGTNLVIEFTAAVYDLPSDFIVVGSTNVAGPYSQAAADIVLLSEGRFRATLPAADQPQFYHVTRYQAPIVPPVITSISLAGGVVTLAFSGYENDQARQFSVVSAPDLAGPYQKEPTAQIQRLSPGVFEATLLPFGPMNFYRIQR